jgi:hypothetical protein
MFAARLALLEIEVNAASQETQEVQEAQEAQDPLEALEVLEHLEQPLIPAQQVLQEHLGWLYNMSIKILGLQKI